MRTETMRPRSSATSGAAVFAREFDSDDGFRRRIGIAVAISLGGNFLLLQAAGVFAKGAPASTLLTIGKGQPSMILQIRKEIAPTAPQPERRMKVVRVKACSHTSTRHEARLNRTTTAAAVAMSPVAATLLFESAVSFPVLVSSAAVTAIRPNPSVLARPILSPNVASRPALTANVAVMPTMSANRSLDIATHRTADIHQGANAPMALSVAPMSRSVRFDPTSLSAQVGSPPSHDFTSDIGRPGRMHGPITDRMGGTLAGRDSGPVAEMDSSAVSAAGDPAISRTHVSARQDPRAIGINSSTTTSQRESREIGIIEPAGKGKEPVSQNVVRSAQSQDAASVGITQNARIHETTIEIPEDLKSTPINVHVTVRITVDASGRHHAEIEQASGMNAIDQQVLATVSRWKCEPALENGKGVASSQKFVLTITNH